MDFNLEDYEEEKNFILNNPATPTLKLMRDFAKEYHKKQLTLTDVVVPKGTLVCDNCKTKLKAQYHTAKGIFCVRSKE